jgi:hypothetical protein
MNAIAGLQAIRGVEKGILIIQCNSVKIRGELLRFLELVICKVRPGCRMFHLLSQGRL